MKTYLIISLILAVVAWTSVCVVRATIGLHESFLMNCFAWFVFLSMANFVVAFIASFFRDSVL